MKNQAKVYPLISNQYTLIFKSASLFLILFLIFSTLSNATTVPLSENSDNSTVTNSFKIKGKVTSEDEAMPGVNIYLKGTQTGTLTDKNGEFTFPKELKAGDILVFSFLGYETYEYTVTENNPEYISIAMEVKSILITGALDEENHKKGFSKIVTRIKSIF